MRWPIKTEMRWRIFNSTKINWHVRASVVNQLDPDVIVLGGGLSNSEALYANLGDRIAHYVFSNTFITPVVQAIHGDSSGVRGAAWLGAKAGYAIETPIL